MVLSVPVPFYATPTKIKKQSAECSTHAEEEKKTALHSASADESTSCKAGVRGADLHIFIALLLMCRLVARREFGVFAAA